MWLKYSIIILLFFLFAILQTSLLSYFNIMGTVPNLVFILFFVLIFFEEKDKYNFGFWAAVIAGFFLDIFMPFYFGISIIVLLAVYFLEKLTAHFIKEDTGKFSIFYFALLFLAYFLTYNIFLYLLSFLFSFQFNFSFNFNILFSIIYNLTFACIGFYIYKKFVKQYNPENQLKLL